MTVRAFRDLCSGGIQKTDYKIIYIEGTMREAKRVFRQRFGRDPMNTTCPCCGRDYSIQTGADIREASRFHRGATLDENGEEVSSNFKDEYESVDEHLERSDVIYINGESKQNDF